MSDTWNGYKNFDEFFTAQCAKFAASPCLTEGETGKSYSYAEMDAWVDRTAAYLVSLGLTKGDRFATLTRNCPEFFFLYLASLKLGTLIVPLAVDIPAEGIRRMAERFGICTLFFGGESEALVAGLGDTIPTLIPIRSLAEKVPADRPDKSLFQNITMDDAGSLYSSSGTTGVPKGIPHTARNLLAAGRSLADVYGFGPTDTQMGVLPCYHTALAMYGFWPSVMVGSNFVLFERFHRTRFWQDLAHYKIAFVEVVPTILTILLNASEEGIEYDLKSLRFIGCGSAPLPVNLHHAFEDKFKVQVANQYGLSEAAPTHLNPPERAKRKDGSIGRPISVCEVKVVSESGEEVKTGETGELIMRGDNVIKGYYELPAESSAVFRDGWFWTGDLGYKDADGFYFLAGRRKEMISRGGQKVYPNEVDNILLGAVGVKEAATIGVPDPVYGEEVVSYVTPVDGTTPDEGAILAYCATLLPKYKCPKKIIFIDEIPKTPSGKIMRRVLAEKYAKEK
ncbi:MAG: hypothetical protein A3J58_01065 [Candidatus Sungbacteria bacterium RIFCSPHIGHO2_02_FULL_52_23]|uniref:AMP-dependent synthetase n=1 Tax=Candidatus Sungbacteria bacterium RIFCSPHIGHO2_02_FULL_52_23 TaxID=1802274 RepID=A0A1G2KXW5_9BACT|nr:MAG: hypothetical protein A3J58_01065 [Candidatus Sungbacteria bacterium RIFCSPHIGHO2_02_FULL_52_23]